MAYECEKIWPKNKMIFVGIEIIADVPAEPYWRGLFDLFDQDESKSIKQFIAY